MIPNNDLKLINLLNEDNENTKTARLKMKDYIKYLLMTFIVLWLFGFWYMIEMGGSSGLVSSHNSNMLDMKLKAGAGAGSGADVLGEISRDEAALLAQSVDSRSQIKMLNRIRRIEKELEQLDLRNKENDFIIKNLRLKEKKFLRILSDTNSLEKNDLRVVKEPYLNKETEEARRKIFNDLKDLDYFMTFQLGKLAEETKNSNTLLKKSSSSNNNQLVLSTIEALKSNFNHRINVLLSESYNLSISGNLGEHRRLESSQLTASVQARLTELQNPSDCESAKKLVCDLTKGCGFGCQMHHILYCLQAAFYTNRTLVLDSYGWQYNPDGIEAYFKPLSNKCTKYKGTPVNWNDEKRDKSNLVKLPIIDSLTGYQKFLPLSVPKQYLSQIGTFHGDPFVWWSGQLLSYIMRYNEKFRPLVNNTVEKLKFKRPCVGVHVRRTDKIGSEAAYHELEEYMQHVDEFFEVYELRTGLSSAEYERTVYLASDEPKVFEEARNSAKYKRYRFVFEERNAQTAQLNQRYTPDSAQGVILDIHMLSECDYLVCTFSSQVCRMAYELMQVRYPDASWRFRSLDDVYYFGGQNPHNVVAMFDHTPAKSDEIELKRGDLVGLAGNHWNGYSKGRNRRTNQEGLFPSYKVADVLTSF